jgi:PKD repeat protein
VTAPEEDQRKLRPPYLALGAAGVVLATLFAIVASLASRTTSEGEPKPVMPGPLTANSSTSLTTSATTDPAQTGSAPPTSTTTATPTTTTSRKPTTTTTTTTTNQPAPPPPPPPPPPKPPVAKFSGSCTNLACTFDGSGSFDPDGTVVYYGWAFGDGAKDEGTRAHSSHTYSAAGTYTVTLVVMDNSGRTSQTSKQFTVTAPQGG